MANAQTVASFLDWQPALKPEEVFKASLSFSYLKVNPAGNLYWVEARPEEGGRCVLMERKSNGEMREVTPKTFSVRSRVFEYGGIPYTVTNDSAYFVNFSDQRLYRQDLADQNKVTPLTVEKTATGALGKYLEMQVSPDGRWLAFAYETEGKDHQVDNFIAVIDLNASLPQEPKILVSGADFYNSPKFSPDGRTLTWVEWNHPFMNWDSTKLMTAEFKEGSIVGKPQLIAGGDDSSIGGHGYLPSGELYFTQDFAGKSETDPKNYYNVFEFKDGKTRSITNETVDHQHLRFSSNEIITLTFDKGRGFLSKIDVKAGKSIEIKIPYIDFGVPIQNQAGDLFFVGLSADRPSELVAQTKGKIEVIKRASNFPVNTADTSPAETIVFPTSDGGKSYGYFFPPKNSRFTPHKGEKPPVRVLIHGGPTAMTSPNFSLSKHFWTTQGYAIFDVNYRGSVGFGRTYRDALKKKWGLLEIQDVKDGLDYLRSAGKISSDATVSGGSAGGYTVQRLLTYYPDLFAAGASHYGIGNLVTLQKLTHKYESHYLQQLIGGSLENNLKGYEERSPINYLSNLKSPMIIFQGADDKVVPPENSREMAAILKKKGIGHEYHEYPGEAHGFRKKENLVETLELEAKFFRRILQGKRTQSQN
jgi:dipeptidyl aminopeptidase/acylaminoacyl peptidase